MKNLKRATIAALAALPMMFLATSCIEEDEIEFSTKVEGYILQHKDMAGQRAFTPYFFVNTTSTHYQLSGVEMTGTGDLKEIPLERFSNYSFKTKMEGRPVASPDGLNGTYTVLSTATTGQQYINTIKLDYTEKDTLGNIELTKFQYDGAYIRATMKEVTNCMTVGLIITPYDKNSTPDRNYNFYVNLVSNPKYVNGELSISYYFLSESSLGNEKARVQLFVTNGDGIYRECDEQKTITRGNSYFDEDKK